MALAFSIEANLVDLHHRKIEGVKIVVENGFIKAIIPTQQTYDRYVLPGFIDAHIHIESSLLVPSEFARMAVVHGTVATVSDPHEIGNVLGVEGVHFMLENAATVPFHFAFGAPSCVPATSFETAGANIGVSDVEQLLKRNDIYYLAEMMNYPGVLHKQQDVIQKIQSAIALDKPVDGHAPGLRGADMQLYFAAGIHTDHECFTFEEGLEKARYGVKILIREGSAARNFDALIPLMGMHPKQLMFCSDDKHPDELELGHINVLVRKAVALGYDLFDVLYAACIHPAVHYKLPVGLLRVGDPADFIVCNNLQQFEVLDTYIQGVHVASGGKSHINTPLSTTPNQFVQTPILESDIADILNERESVIVCKDGALVTERKDLPSEDCSVSNDVLKLVVVNRYKSAPPAVAYIQGFGLKAAALASSVAHDSHNIIAVGTSDELICKAVNAVIQKQGGLAFAAPSEEACLPLPVAGLMSNQPGEQVAAAYTQLDQFAKQAGSPLRAPFMSLSFMALLVIPSLKLSDLGLFDGTRFEFINRKSV